MVSLRVAAATEGILLPNSLIALLNFTLLIGTIKLICANMQG